MNNDRKSRGLSGATIISFVVILVVVLWMANQLQMHQQEMTYTSFVSAVQEKNVSDVYINQNSAVPTGTVSGTAKRFIFIRLVYTAGRITSAVHTQCRIITLYKKYRCTGEYIPQNIIKTFQHIHFYIRNLLF